MATNNSTNNWSPLTTKGDLFTYDSAPQRLGIGSNYYYPMADSTQSVGISYQLPIPQAQVSTNTSNDFIGSTVSDSVVFASSSGTGSSSGIVDNIDNTHFGILKLDMGTTTTGKAYIYQQGSNVFQLGASIITLECDINLNTLSNGTDTYSLFFGLTDNPGNTITPNNGVYIGYNSGVNSGNLTINANKAAGGVQTTNTSFALTAATWYKLRLVITNTTSVQAFASVAGSDFSSIGTLTTALPTVVIKAFQIMLLKSAGTTDTFGYVDYVTTKTVYNSLR